MNHTGFLGKLIEPLRKRTKTPRGAMASTGAIAISINAVADLSTRPVELLWRIRFRRPRCHDPGLPAIRVFQPDQSGDLVRLRRPGDRHPEGRTRGRTGTDAGAGRGIVLRGARPERRRGAGGRLEALKRQGHTVSLVCYQRTHSHFLAAPSPQPCCATRPPFTPRCARTRRYGCVRPRTQPVRRSCGRSTGRRPALRRTTRRYQAARRDNRPIGTRWA